LGAELHEQWPIATQGGAGGIRLESTQIILFLKTPKSKLNLKGDYKPRVHSGQMVLVKLGREVEPVVWWPKTLN
jgi:hypothetical protein